MGLLPQHLFRHNAEIKAPVILYLHGVLFMATSCSERVHPMACHRDLLPIVRQHPTVY